MLHHLAEDGLRHGIDEIARVLKPGGKFLVVDIGAAAHRKRHGLHMRRRRAEFDLNHVVLLLESAGFQVVEEGPAGGPHLLMVPNLRFVLAVWSAAER